jgi:GAF domain-containing protein
LDRLTSSLGRTIDVNAPQDFEIALQRIIKGIGSSIGDRFFALLVQHLAVVLKFRCALIATVSNQAGVKPLAVWTAGCHQPITAAQIEPIFSHPSQQRAVYFCARGALQQFPNLPLLATMEIESYLSVPVLDSAGQTIATLAVLDHQEMSFSSGVKTILLTFAARIGAELEHLKLADALRQNVAQQLLIATQLHYQSERDRLLKDISLQVRQSLDLQETLNTTVTQVQQFLQADRVLIYHLDTEPSGVLIAAATTSDWALTAGDLSQTWQTSHSSGCRQTDPPLVYEWNDVCVTDSTHQCGHFQNSDSSEYSESFIQLDAKARLIVPISHGNTLWGLLAVHQCSQPRQWQSFEVDLLEQLATQVAIAIQQAQLFEKVQRQAQQEQLLNQISRSISSSLDPEHILQEIVRLTGECFQVDRVIIYQIDQQIRVINEWRQSEQTPTLLGQIYRREEWTDLTDPNSDFLNHRAFHVPKFDQLPHSPERWAGIQQRKTLSVLCAPIGIRGQIFGGLSLHMTTCHRTFSQDEILLLERIADQMAIALYNAQTYEQLEQLVQVRTQEVEAEKLISETANRAKSEFLAVMSHELRTPLNAILGLSDLLEREFFGTLNLKQQEYITCIHSSGKHLLSLIGDILDLSKVEAGKEELVLSQVNIADLCAYCLSVVKEKAIEAGLKLSQSIDPQIDVWIADERRLRQMMLNLLSNAIKFTPSGEVSLLVEKQP